MSENWCKHPHIFYRTVSKWALIWLCLRGKNWRLFAASSIYGGICLQCDQSRAGPQKSAGMEIWSHRHSPSPVAQLACSCGPSFFLSSTVWTLDSPHRLRGLLLSCPHLALCHNHSFSPSFTPAKWPSLYMSLFEFVLAITGQWPPRLLACPPSI